MNLRYRPERCATLARHATRITIEALRFMNADGEGDPGLRAQVNNALARVLNRERKERMVMSRELRSFASSEMYQAICEEGRLSRSTFHDAGLPSHMGHLLSNWRFYEAGRLAGKAEMGAIIEGFEGP